jgi:hypothetical protein
MFRHRNSKTGLEFNAKPVSSRKDAEIAEKELRKLWFIRHSRGSGNPEESITWIPASAGMTTVELISVSIILLSFLNSLSYNRGHP